MTSLAGHRIARIDPLRIRSRYPRTIGRNARLGAHGDGPTTRAWRVETDAGAVGWGLDDGPEADPNPLVARALDVALHDLAAQVLDVPLHRMLGGTDPAPVIPCYSGAIYFDDLDPEEAPRGIEGVLAACAADHAAGYRAFKLKLGRGNRWMETEAGFARDPDAPGLGIVLR